MSDVTGTASGPPATPIADVIITKISRVGFCIRVAGIMALLFACWYAALHPDGAAAKDVFLNRVWWIFALLLTPTLFWLLWVRLRQMIFHGGRAVWIENGRLNFIDDAGLGRSLQSLAIADIRELAIDRVHISWEPWGFPCVAVKMKGGWVIGYIMTLFFTDSAPVVRDRLAQALALPKAS
ncbi:MAG TPA: hypothetical protein VMU31_06850 [Rhizomicrobium sp.]|nr:hypothetical protein [Rhizomicrobium sp.]